VRFRRGCSRQGVPGTKRAHAGSLDSAAAEAIQLFVRALARRGASPEAMTAAFASACRRIPQSLIDQARGATREVVDATHILSVWFKDPLFLDRSGQPLALSVRGEAPSFESLVKRVDSDLDPQTVLRYLLQANGLWKIGSRYAPRSRALDLRGTGGPTHARTFRTVLALLRTIERNMQPAGKVSSSFEFSAENPHFPLRAREDFGAKVRQAGLAFLDEQDSAMLTYERNRDPGEPTVRMGVGIYLFDDSGEAKPVRIAKMPKQRIRRNSRGKRRG
jgi:hypothetical protein